MANENKVVDVFHELSVLDDLIWEYGELRISEYEGSECAANENRRDINEKFEIIKREIAAKEREIAKRDALIRELTSFIQKTSEAANNGETIGAGWFCDCDELIAKTREVVK